MWIDTCFWANTFCFVSMQIFSNNWFCVYRKKHISVDYILLVFISHLALSFFLIYIISYSHTEELTFESDWKLPFNIKHVIIETHFLRSHSVLRTRCIIFLLLAVETTSDPLNNLNSRFQGLYLKVVEN